MGLSLMLHLLRYRELAVVYYRGAPFALHLQHAQQSLNLGLLLIKYITLSRVKQTATGKTVKIRHSYMKQVGHYEMIGINSRQLYAAEWGMKQGKKAWHEC